MEEIAAKSQIQFSYLAGVRPVQLLDPALQNMKKDIFQNSLEFKYSAETCFLAEHCCGTMFTILEKSKSPILEKSKFAQKFKFCGNLFSGRALLWNHVYATQDYLCTCLLNLNIAGVRIGLYSWSRVYLVNVLFVCLLPSALPLL